MELFLARPRKPGTTFPSRILIDLASFLLLSNVATGSRITAEIGEMAATFGRLTAAMLAELVATGSRLTAELELPEAACSRLKFSKAFINLSNSVPVMLLLTL